MDIKLQQIKDILPGGIISVGVEKGLVLRGRMVRRQIICPAEPTQFGAWYAATEYLRANGYSCGARDFPNPTAFVAGKYTLPQKWNDLSADQRATVAGIITSRDPKNCEVNVYFFE